MSSNHPGASRQERHSSSPVATPVVHDAIYVLRFDAPRIDAGQGTGSPFSWAAARNRVAHRRFFLASHFKIGTIVEIGFLPSEVEPAAQIRATCRSSREAVRWFCEHRENNVAPFPVTSRKVIPPGREERHGDRIARVKEPRTETTNQSSIRVSRRTATPSAGTT